MKILVGIFANIVQVKQITYICRIIRTTNTDQGGRRGTDRRPQPTEQTTTTTTGIRSRRWINLRVKVIHYPTHPIYLLLSISQKLTKPSGETIQSQPRSLLPLPAPRTCSIRPYNSDPCRWVWRGFDTPSLPLTYPPWMVRLDPWSIRTIISVLKIDSTSSPLHSQVFIHSFIHSFIHPSFHPSCIHHFSIHSMINSSKNSDQSPSPTLFLKFCSIPNIECVERYYLNVKFLYFSSSTPSS